MIFKNPSLIFQRFPKESWTKYSGDPPPLCGALCSRARVAAAGICMPLPPALAIAHHPLCFLSSELGQGPILFRRPPGSTRQTTVHLQDGASCCMVWVGGVFVRVQKDACSSRLPGANSSSQLGLFPVAWTFTEATALARLSLVSLC